MMRKVMFFLSFFIGVVESQHLAKEIGKMMIVESQYQNIKIYILLTTMKQSKQKST